MTEAMRRYGCYFAMVFACLVLVGCGPVRMASEKDSGRYTQHDLFSQQLASGAFGLSADRSGVITRFGQRNIVYRRTSETDSTGKTLCVEEINATADTQEEEKSEENLSSDSSLEAARKQNYQLLDRSSEQKSSSRRISLVEWIPMALMAVLVITVAWKKG